MASFSVFSRITFAAWMTVPFSFAQETSRTVSSAPAAGSASDASILTRRDARTITLKIPAPRGQIVDRYGKTFAQNVVAYQVALQYPQFEKADRDFVVNWGRTRLDALQGIIKNPVNKSDDELYDHYRHRRWLPLLVSGHISQKEAGELESRLTAGVILHPVYSRFYPHGDSAAHIIGYTGSVGKLPTGPINFNEPLWEESEGRAGLEKHFDRQLSGEAGMKRLLFDERGNRLLEEQVKRPRAGGTVVTTINRDWQLLAENVLRKGCQRGAFVVLDVVTGEVLVMASRPSFDLNDFIPGISGAEYKALEENPATPLYSRAFQSVYPPASSYKPVVALAALNNGVITERSTIYCPAFIRLGNHTFNNHNRRAEGDLNVRRAMARSNNPWFIQAGIRVGPTSFLDLSRRMGMGSRTGLPIDDNPGLVPDNTYMQRVHKRRMLDGDTANMSIGQGDLLASPLQVAQFMAGIANGKAMPKLQLVRQIQDSRGRVVQASVPERREWLGVSEAAIDIVRDGMRDVVAAGYGTGRSANLSYTTLAGKTGTAQWGPQRLNQRLAWFAGFLPHDNPRYAFAVLYEGRPNERVSGGGKAAPMVRNFFEPIKDDIKDIIAPPQRALIVVDESVEGAGAEDVADLIEGTEIAPLKALPVEPLVVGEEPEIEDEPLQDDDFEFQQEDFAPPVIRAIPVHEDEPVEP